MSVKAPLPSKKGPEEKVEVTKTIETKEDWKVEKRKHDSLLTLGDQVFLSSSIDSIWSASSVNCRLDRPVEKTVSDAHNNSEWTIHYSTDGHYDFGYFISKCKEKYRKLAFSALHKFLELEFEGAFNILEFHGYGEKIKRTNA